MLISVMVLSGEIDDNIYVRYIVLFHMTVIIKFNNAILFNVFVKFLNYVYFIILEMILEV